MKSFFRLVAILLLLLSASTARPTTIDKGLIVEIESGNVREVRRLLDAGANANASDDFGVTPLHYAAAMGHSELLELLIARGANINARSKEGVSPLYVAADRGGAEATRLLISHGADVNVRTRSNYTPLTPAATNGDLAMVELLIEHNADVSAVDGEGRSPLLWALKGLQAKWTITSSAPGAVSERKEMGEAAVNEHREMLGSVPGHWLDVAKLLIEHGADVNIALEDDTPIGFAALMGEKELVRALLAKGANINGAENAYETPLHAAIAEKHRDTAEFLVNSGADVNAWNRSRRTPLHFVAHYMDDPELVELMISRGANVNAKDKNGATPLSFAAKARNKKTAKVLRSRGGK